MGRSENRDQFRSLGALTDHARGHDISPSRALPPRRGSKTRHLCAARGHAHDLPLAASTRAADRRAPLAREFQRRLHVGAAVQQRARSVAPFSLARTRRCLRAWRQRPGRPAALCRPCDSDGISTASTRSDGRGARTRSAIGAAGSGAPAWVTQPRGDDPAATRLLPAVGACR